VLGPQQHQLLYQKLSLNKDTAQQDSTSQEPPAELPAPEPKIDIGLGNLDKEKDKIKRQ
jgi:hypothetical protein